MNKGLVWREKCHKSSKLNFREIFNTIASQSLAVREDKINMKLDNCVFLASQICFDIIKTVGGNDLNFNAYVLKSISGNIWCLRFLETTLYCHISLNFFYC